MGIEKIKGYFRGFAIERDNPDLLRAQFSVLSRQLPLMYGMLLVNMWALSGVYMSAAPAWATVYIPAFFSIAGVARIIGWWSARNNTPTPEFAYKVLTRTNRLAVIITVILTSWSLSLFPYGDVYMQSNIAFFMAISGVGVIICLLQLRTAAFLVALVINTPFVIFFAMQGNSTYISMAVNMALVIGVMLLVVKIQSDHFVGAVVAQTKLEAANKENQRLANRDSLTGLTNRRQFFSHLSDAFEAAKADEKRLAVGIVDLDGFKPVNDLYGHVVGDALLVEVGRRLTALCDENVHVSRLGGDEFAFTVTDFDQDEVLIELGERICAALREPINVADVTAQISGSLGIAVYPDLADSVFSLYERADYALYQIKRANPGNPMLFSSDHIAQIEMSSRIEQTLRTADLANELSVMFQPIVDVKTKQTMAFEALARWNSPTLGKIGPNDFIPVAEKAGIVSDLTRVLLEKSLAVAVTWPKDVRLSFNLSAHDISSNEGAVRIVGIILASGFDPKRLDLEITETAMFLDFTQAKASIDTLKDLGCGIALDDFGTGYSSLSQLHALPLTKIKIDRSFVSNLDKNPASYKIVKSLLALSRDMDLGCVIEGVETDEEMAALNDLGGQLVQGYYYSPPVSEDEAVAYYNATASSKAS